MRFRTLMACLALATALLAHGADAPSSATAVPAPSGLERVRARLQECASGCELREGVGCITPQACTLWSMESMLAAFATVTARHAETRACGDAVAGVMLYELATQAEAQTALEFSRGFIWGKGQPTPEHPEAVFLDGNVLVVVSARKPKALAECLKGRPKK
jgi:hypothetical protein